MPGCEGAVLWQSVPAEARAGIPLRRRGGLGRNRTGIGGFAVRCITTLPPGRARGGGAIPMPCNKGQARPQHLKPFDAIVREPLIKTAQHVEGRRMTDFALARRNIVEGQLRPNRVTNGLLLAAVGDLPRETIPARRPALGRLFRRGRAARQGPLPDGADGSGPADPDPAAGPRGDQALVVGSGRGYGAALLAGSCKPSSRSKATRPWPRRRADRRRT